MIKRSPNNPLVTPAADPSIGDNINGPSVIRVPDWLRKPLGKYYMYFANHGGKFIRLAYADNLHGPWQIYRPGTLQLEQARAFSGHLASPDVHVDHERREIRMYFHGLRNDRKGQWSGVATSRDGLHFTASDQVLAKFYLRVFRYGEDDYGLAKDDNQGFGVLSRSPDGLTPFTTCSQFINGMRHAAVVRRDDQLLIFYSRKGDAPERILMTAVRLAADWRDWVESEPIEILQPETEYEGIKYPNQPSQYGPAVKVRQLRDPYVFVEDGTWYLFYSIAGEMGIAMAEIKRSFPAGQI